eukprot:6469343-Amphidinium_carterae.1
MLCAVVAVLQGMLRMSRVWNVYVSSDSGYRHAKEQLPTDLPESALDSLDVKPLAPCSPSGPDSGLDICKCREIPHPPKPPKIKDTQK